MNRTKTDLRDIFKTPRQKSYTIIGLTLVTVTFFFFFAIRPTLAKIGKIQDEIKQLQATEAQVDAKLAKLVELINLRDQNRAEIDAFEKYFPAEKETSLLVANYEEIAKKYDLLLTRVAFSDYQDQEYESINGYEGNYKAIKTEITVEGEIKDIQKYLIHLEDYPRIMKVSRLSISPVEESVTDVNQERTGYTANFILDVYYYKEPEAVQTNILTTQ